MPKKQLEPNAVCEVCGVHFHVKPSALKHTHYCSKSCHDTAQSQKVKANCHGCGKPILVPPSRANSRKRNFCSNACRLAWLPSQVKANLNVPGHSTGHKAPHLTALNNERNPKLAIEADAVRRGEYSDHRRIMEQHLGRKLESWEDVHHINGIHSDNRIENLVVMTHSEHMRLHWQLAKERGVI